MLNFSRITIDEKEIIMPFLKKASHYRISELSFSNFLMWENKYNFKYSIINGFLCIISNYRNGDPFCFFPQGNVSDKIILKETILELKEFFKINNWKFRLGRVNEIELSLIKELFSDEKYIFCDDRDNADYVYCKDDLIHLKGKKYDGKRNHINKFKKIYEHEIITIDESNIDKCKEILDKWYESKTQVELEVLEEERISNNILLNNFNKLDVEGIIIKVNGVFEGITIGEYLSDDTIVVHLEKANPNINGLYTFINQKFCEMKFNKMTYINREQDLGILGLRKAKLSYHPKYLVKKYIVKVCI